MPACDANEFQLINQRQARHAYFHKNRAIVQPVFVTLVEELVAHVVAAEATVIIYLNL